MTTIAPRRLLPLVLLSATAALSAPGLAIASRGADDASNPSGSIRHGDGNRATTDHQQARGTGSKAGRGRPWADLTVRDLRLGDDDSDDDRVTVDATVANGGTKSVRPSFVTVSIVADDTDDEPILLATLPVGRIAAGASTATRTSVVIPQDLPDGDLSLEVCADATEMRRERDEDNNCSDEPFATAVEADEVDEVEGEDDGDDAEALFSARR